MGHLGQGDKGLHRGWRKYGILHKNKDQIIEKYGL